MYWRGDRGQIHGLLAGQLVSLQASAVEKKPDGYHQRDYDDTQPRSCEAEL